MSENEKIIAKAESYLGKGGAIFNKYCGMPTSSPWCNAFVCYIFNACGLKNLYYGGKTVVYCPNSRKWCLANLAEVPPYLAMAGDVIYFDWNRNDDPDHIGFVRYRIDDTQIATVEGNTSGGKVANKVRPKKYILGIFRPHYKASFDTSKPLVIDGQFGYNSIACLQKALGVGVDGQLGQITVKALQRKVGASPVDGLWGTKTSKAVQKFLKNQGCYNGAIDGCFYIGSVKALQTWINKANGKATTPSPVVTKSWQDKCNDWARNIANSKYHYVKWQSKVEATHTCPICKGRKYNNYYGWNCIGFAYACWAHGGQLGTKCNCGVISNEVAEKMLKVSQSEANKMATSRIGKSVTVIRNGGKAIPVSSLKAGDICMLYKGSKYYHTIFYMGNGKYAESNTTGGIGSSKNIRADLTLSSTAKANLKVAIRPI